MLWRLVGVLLLRTKKDLSEPRNAAAWKGLRLIALRSWPRKEFLEGTAFGEVMGYAFHVGFLVALLFLVPHVLFFADVFEGLLGFDFSDVFGFAWPTLPNGSHHVPGRGVARGAGRGAGPPPHQPGEAADLELRRLLQLVADRRAAGHRHAAPTPTPAARRTRRCSASHILSVELLLVWFPFGKLMHAFTIFAARGATGMIFERKGASL